MQASAQLDPCPAPPRRQWGPYVRRVRRELWQARFRVAPVGVVSLGLYPSPEAAHRVAVEFRRLGGMLSPSDFLRVLGTLQTRGLAPPSLLPTWVRRVAGGFAALRRTPAGWTLLGPFATAEAAFWAMLAMVRGGLPS